MSIARKHLGIAFLIAFVIKLFFFIFFAYFFIADFEEDKTINLIFAKSNDYGSYVYPTENLIDKGELFEADGGKKLYAHKMPGMLPIYAPLYWFFGHDMGLTILVLIQFLLDVLGTLLVGIIAYRLFNNEKIFWITLLIYSFSTYVSIYTHYALSETFCATFVILSLYFFQNYRLGLAENRNLFLSGLFVCWAIFMRPTSIVLLFILAGYLIYVLRQARFLFIVQRLILFSGVFVFFETVWIIRGYKVSGDIILADQSRENFGTPSLLAVFSFVQAIGGDLQSWNSDSEMRWFAPPSNAQRYDSALAASNPFPQYVFDSGITLDELKKFRSLWYKVNDPLVPEEEVAVTSKELIEFSENLTQRFKANKPVHYWIISPIRTSIDLVFVKSVQQLPFIKTTIFQKIARSVFTLSYLIMVCFSLLAFILLVKSEKNIFYLVVLLHVFLIGFILRLTENRYIVTVYPIICIYASYTIHTILELFPFYRNHKIA